MASPSASVAAALEQVEALAMFCKLCSLLTKPRTEQQPHWDLQGRLRLSLPATPNALLVELVAAEQQRQVLEEEEETAVVLVQDYSDLSLESVAHLRHKVMPDIATQYMEDLKDGQQPPPELFIEATLVHDRTAERGFVLQLRPQADGSSGLQVNSWRLMGDILHRMGAVLECMDMMVKHHVVFQEVRVVWKKRKAVAPTRGPVRPPFYRYSSLTNNNTLQTPVLGPAQGEDIAVASAATPKGCCRNGSGSTSSSSTTTTTREQRSHQAAHEVVHESHLSATPQPVGAKRGPLPHLHGPLGSSSQKRRRLTLPLVHVLSRVEKRKEKEKEQVEEEEEEEEEEEDEEDELFVLNSDHADEDDEEDEDYTIINDTTKKPTTVSNTARSQTQELTSPVSSGSSCASFPVLVSSAAALLPVGEKRLTPPRDHDTKLLNMVGEIENVDVAKGEKQKTDAIKQEDESEEHDGQKRQLAEQVLDPTHTEQKDEEGEEEEQQGQQALPYPKAQQALPYPKAQQQPQQTAKIQPSPGFSSPSLTPLHCNPAPKRKFGEAFVICDEAQIDPCTIPFRPERGNDANSKCNKAPRAEVEDFDVHARSSSTAQNRVEGEPLPVADAFRDELGKATSGPSRDQRRTKSTETASREADRYETLKEQLFHLLLRHYF